MEVAGKKENQGRERGETEGRQEKYRQREKGNMVKWIQPTNGWGDGYDFITSKIDTTALR